MSSLATRFGKNRTEVRSAYPLTDDEIFRVAPSIFAPGRHESRSERYTYIPTSDILAGLRKEGFEVYQAGQSRSRIPGKSDFTKHLVRLRHANTAVKNDANEVVLVNSHDGTSSYQMMAGKIRFVCMNGLVCGDITDDIRIKHSGDIMGRVIDAAYEVVGKFDQIDDQTQQMKELRLDRDEERVFAQAALAIKYDPQLGTPPISPDQIVVPRRREDADLTLWNTYNRAQENLIRGGLQGRTAAGRRISTRGVTGIDSNIEINRGLWILAEGMRRLKNGESPDLPVVEAERVN